MKRFISIALVSLLVLCSFFAIGVYAEDGGREITVTLNGEAIEFDVPPQIIESRTMVPLRAIFEALGAEVDWDDATKTAIGVKGDITVKITINDNILYKNDKAIELDVPAQIVDSRTLVPVRAISESFEVNVDWIDETSTVVLTTAKSSVTLTADSFVAGNGYNIIDNEGKQLDANSPVTVADSEDGVVVKHGGYYQNGVNWGGVATKDAYVLDGLSVTVKFDKVPMVNPSDDCWIAIDFLTKPQLFQVGDVPGNQGYMQLIRFGVPKLEIYDGVEAFKGIETVEEDAGKFAIKTGDTVTMSAKLVDGFYTFTYTKGNETYSYKMENEAFKDVFEDGKAYIAISASLKGSSKDAFKYTILDISESL